jgi:DNA-binding MarR family transcriptional regulator
MAKVEAVAHEMARLWPKLLRGIRHPAVSRLNLTSAQMLILASLHELKECRVTTLAREKGVSLPTITGLLDRLVRASFVRRRRDDNDRRTVWVSLSRKGERAIEDILRLVRRRWINIAGRLTDNEREVFVKVLRKLVRVLSESEPV